MGRRGSASRSRRWNGNFVGEKQLVGEADEQFINVFPFGGPQSEDGAVLRQKISKMPLVGILRGDDQIGSLAGSELPLFAEVDASRKVDRTRRGGRVHSDARVLPKPYGKIVVPDRCAEYFEIGK